MKVYKDGKEVKNAKVIYTTFGTVDTIQLDGVHYAPSAFELKEDKGEVKTKDSEEKTVKPVKKTVKKSKK